MASAQIAINVVVLMGLVLVVSFLVHRNVNVSTRVAQPCSVILWGLGEGDELHQPPSDTLLVFLPAIVVRAGVAFR
jgi:hypothetical protein